MTTTTKGGATVAVCCVLAMSAAAREHTVGPLELLRDATHVAVCELGEPEDVRGKANADGIPLSLVGIPVDCETREVIKGEVPNLIALAYPPRQIEARQPYVEPIVGTVVLAFLGAEGEDGRYGTSWGYQGIKRIGADETRDVAAMLQAMLDWSTRSPGERERIVQRALEASVATRRLAIDLLLFDEGLDLIRQGIASEATFRGVAAACRDEIPVAKRNALGVLGLLNRIRPGYVETLVDALDDPYLRPTAIVYLDGSRGFGPGPAFPEGLSDEEKMILIKEWWPRREADQRN